jgi:hypothetical protein
VNLGILLTFLSLRKEWLALVEAKEALGIHGRRSIWDLNLMDFDLGMTHKDLRIAPTEVDRRDEALAVSKEAVTIYRRFATAHPESFQEELSNSLRVRSEILLVFCT